MEVEVVSARLSADLVGAHARLSKVDPALSEPRRLEEILLAFLGAAGVSRGMAVDPRAPGDLVLSGVEPEAGALAGLERALADPSLRDGTLPPAVVRDLFGCEADEPVLDPRAIPITVDDETVAFVILEGPPADPVGLASVTSHAAAILARLRMLEKVREADFELKYRVWELESLYDVGLSIASTLDMESLADDILLKSVSLLNARKGTLVVRDLSGDGKPLVKDFGGVLVTGEEIEFPDDGVFVSNERSGRIGALAEAPAEKLLGVSIRSDTGRLGVLFVADKENRSGGIDDFNESDKRILKLFANQAAIALENARLHREAVEKERMEREIELAASIQRTILPAALPRVAGLLLAGGNRPTRQVGGDYFDVFPLADGRVAFCVADVSGKGVPAALLVSTVHACLHLLVEAGASDLPRMASRINRHLLRFSATRKYVTLFVAVFDPATHVLRYLNAGHNPALWRSRGEIQLLSSGGLPIGMLADVIHQEAAIEVAAGDLLVLYSDGITEAINASEEEFGMERLTELVASSRDESPAALTDRIFGAVSDFTPGVAQYDDQTVLAALVL